MVVFNCRPHPNIYKYGMRHWWDNETFEQSGAENSFRHLLKSSAIYESSDSQFFKITTGIQSGPVAFDESRFVAIF